jgi:DNA-binding NtrC family response regulator
MKRTVLVVDDEPSLNVTMRIILEAKGYGVAEAENAGQAIEWIRRRKFDALLADMNLPGDGGTVVRAMREQQPGSLIVVITGFIAPDAIPAPVRALVDEVLTKPTDIAHLLALLARRLS